MAHLLVRTAYTLLEGTMRPKQIVHLAKEQQAPWAAIADRNVMFGTMEFWHACKNAGVHPVIGMEVKTEDTSFLLLAKNDAGLQDLYALSTQLQEDKEISLATLQTYASNCFVILTLMDDRLESLLYHEDKTALKDELISLKNQFPKLIFAQSMMDNSMRKDRMVWAMDMARQLDMPIVALSAVYYEKEEDVQILKVLRAIDLNTTVHDGNLDAGLHRHWRSPAEMERLYDAEALEEADKLAISCHVTMGSIHTGLPVFENRLHISSQEYLNRLARAGLNKRMGEKLREGYKERLEYELSVINSMGFTDYFLIVYDILRFAQSKGILTGPGRGSAAGSLTAYCLGITHIDPIAHGLLFERFLNPQRISMPDIDTDFPDDRRQEVLEYVIEKYGPDHAAQIVTFANFKAKQAIRDCTKALGFSARLADRMCALVPTLPNGGVSLKDMPAMVPKFQTLLQDKDARQVYELALGIEGLPRHLSLHAAGIVLSDQDLIKAAPLVNVSGQWAVQYTMEYLEELGLIKIDLLGLRNLTICAQINSRLDKPLNLWKMAPDDPAAYRLLSQGDTLGVFQLEKEGIRQLLRRMQPHTFADIAIVLALYRPGPMQEIDTYLKNRAHPESIDWLHPSLRPILEETYGVMIYQEQIMQAAVAAGGFTLAEADILRKAMSKKNKDVMDSYRTKFLEGAKEKGIGQETANRIFDLMEKFSGYGFNKAHSYAYGRIAYVMAYLKANHPLIFYQCVLEGTLGSAVKTGQYLSECRRRGIQILPADLRLSQGEYVIEGNALRLPLTLLKGIGKALMPRLEAARALDLSGPVQTIASLWASKVTEAQILTLIDGGALDWLGESRLTLRDNLPKIIDYAHIVRVEKEGMLFDYSIVSMPNLVKKKENVLERSVREKEAYGFYVSEHPVQALRKERFAQVPLISRIEEVSGYVQLIGRVADFHTHKTKKGDMMAFAVLEDESGQIDLAVMPRLLAEKRELLAEGSLVFIKGKKDRPNSVLVNQMEKIELEAS